MEAKRGMIVCCAAGHDKGIYMVITAVEGNRVFICDGRSRKLDKPKRKNIRHLRFTRSTVDMNGLTDKKLRSELYSYTEKVRAGTRNDPSAITQISGDGYHTTETKDNP